MFKLASRSILGLIVLICLGCANDPTSIAPSKPNEKLRFVDIDAFDRDLAVSLGSELKQVDVQFYEKVSPNAMPSRLQKWIKTAEGSGGKVQINPPDGELVARDPFALLSLFGTLFSGVQAAMKVQQESLLNSARDHDVQIFLERASDGRVQVNKIIFQKRPS
ncbi:MAG: hypothetical protein RLZZ596_1732 [Pseudomonadota bacterium]|jgi:hypothetical protein